MVRRAAGFSASMVYPEDKAGRVIDVVVNVVLF